MSNFQRQGSSSNSHVGETFEEIIREYFQNKYGIKLKKGISIKIGVSSNNIKEHKFDLGTNENNKKILIECKSHTWTQSDHVPNAKMTVWNEAMYYFFLAPKGFKKIFFIEKQYSKKRGKTLGQYYIEKYRHLIPNDVEIWEYDLKEKTHKILKTPIV